MSAAGGRAGGQRELRFWDLASGSPVGPALVGSPPGDVLAAAALDGRGVLVTSRPYRRDSR